MCAGNKAWPRKSYLKERLESDSLLTVQVVEANDVRGAVGHIVKGILQSLRSF